MTDGPTPRISCEARDLEPPHSMTTERAPAMDRASLRLQRRLVSFIRLFGGTRSQASRCTRSREDRAGARYQRALSIMRGGASPRAAWTLMYVTQPECHFVRVPSGVAVSTEHRG